MNTPIYNFVADYAARNTVRAHMPGHKGKVCGNLISNLYPLDITEIKSADSLFEAVGIIRESEDNASLLYGSKRTLFSAGGSTLCIQTMLSLACKSGTTVIAARNAHKAFFNTCALLDLRVNWIFPSCSEKQSIVSCNYNTDDIEAAIVNSGSVSAVYITSPDYYGRIYDISSISKICRKYNLPLLVDNAHGAHLAFLEDNIHPISLGADMCCDSAHKTLPVLTGGAYLHITNELYTADAKDTMSIFASTSPSYLILSSLDLCNEYISDNKQSFQAAADRVLRLKKILSKKYTVLDTEPFKITISAASVGLIGSELYDILRKGGIECEYADNEYIVLMFSPFNSEDDYILTEKILMSVNNSTFNLDNSLISIPKPMQAMTLREAALSDNVEIPVIQSEGRICGKAKVLCPPGIPIVAPGEIIDKDCINFLNKYGILKVNVVKC